MRFNAIGNGRFSALLTRTFWIKSGEAAAPTLADEITPVVEVNNQADPATAFLRNERLAAAWNNITTIPLNYAKIRLVNPFNSGVLCVVDAAHILSDTNGLITAAINYGYLGTTSVGFKYFTDTRWTRVSAGQPFCGVEAYIDTLNPLTTNPVIQLWRYTTPDLVTFRQPLVLGPGSALEFAHATIATPLIEASISWRERPIAAEELATG